MTRITTNLGFWLLLGGIASFGLLYPLLGQSAMVEIGSGCLLGACVVIGLTWLPTAYRGVVNGALHGAEVLALGLCTLGIFGTIRQGWTFLYRFYDRPDSMLDHWSYPLILWSVFWSLLIVILAPGTHGGEVPAANKRYMIVVAIIGAFAAGFATAFQLTQVGF